MNPVAKKPHRSKQRTLEVVVPKVAQSKGPAAVVPKDGGDYDHSDSTDALDSDLSADLHPDLNEIIDKGVNEEDEGGDEEDEGGDEVSEGPRAPKESRIEAFGPFSVSKIFVKGVHRGWGGNCGRHWDSNSSLGCKKSFTSPDPACFDECHRLAKAWLLMGLDIEAFNGRLSHVHAIKRNQIALMTHAELDEAAAGVL